MGFGQATTKQNRLISPEIGRFWGLGSPPQSKIALSRRDRTIFGVWAGRHKAKSPYYAEIGRFWGLGRPPQSKIALSRRDRTILGFGQASTKQNCLISVWVWAGHRKAKSPYLAEIGRFWGLGRPPQSKIALSRRDRTILGFGQATSHHKAKSHYLAEIGRFWGLGRPLGFGQATTKQNRLISPR